MHPIERFILDYLDGYEGQFDLATKKLKWNEQVRSRLSTSIPKESPIDEWMFSILDGNFFELLWSDDKAISFVTEILDRFKSWITPSHHNGNSETTISNNDNNNNDNEKQEQEQLEKLKIEISKIKINDHDKTLLFVIAIGSLYTFYRENFVGPAHRSSIISTNAQVCELFYYYFDSCFCFLLIHVCFCFLIFLVDVSSNLSTSRKIIFRIEF